MSENVFGIWKHRFPVTRNMRNHVPLAEEVIMTTALLHNISILWNDELPVGDADGVQAAAPEAQRDFIIVDGRADRNAAREAGQLLRDQLREAMVRHPRRRN